LARAGHQVTISAFYGREGSALRNEDGLLELPRATDLYGNDIIQAHRKFVQADLVFSLIDPFVLQPTIWGTFPWAAWVPVDSAPMLPQNVMALQSARWVIAMSRFGETQLRAAGFNPLYVPHGIETGIFKPIDRALARAEFARFTERDVSDKFVVMSVAANKDAPSRKNFAGMIEAFAGFSAEHPDAVFYLHTEPNGIWRGESILTIAQAYGVADKIILPSQYAIVCGLVDSTLMNHLYNAADVFLLLSRGEGFGIPIVEAQSAGCPVIVTDFSASAELGSTGWTVPIMPYMFVPGAWQAIALSTEAQHNLATTYALKQAGRLEEKRQAARTWALAYDADRVMATYWQPALTRIEADLASDNPVNAVPERTQGPSRPPATTSCADHEMPLEVAYA